MTLKQNYSTLKDGEGIEVGPDDACVIAHHEGGIDVLTPPGPPSDLTKAIMFMAISLKDMGVKPFAQRFDEYMINYPGEKLETTLQ